MIKQYPFFILNTNSMKRILTLIVITIVYFTNTLNAQSPIISAINPTSAAAGSTVIIAGSNFTGVTGISFGGVPAASYTVITSSAITAVVGNGASGNVSVTNGSGTGSISGFTYIASAPKITSFSPLSGPIGTSVTISGSNFSTTVANNFVYFGAVKATVTAATATSLTVTVPYGATFQPISVTTNNLTAYSLSPYFVTFTGGGTLDNNSFGGLKEFSSGAGPNFSGIQDIDGDGKPDMISVNQSANTVSIFRNTTTSKNNVSFANKQDVNTGSFPLGASFADFDGDGMTDMIVSNYNSNTISVYRNTSTSGSISFSAAQSYATGTRPGYAQVADIDGDGKPDIIEANNSSNSLSIFINTSSGTGNISFATKVDVTVGSAPSIIAIADIDGDGKVDIVCPNQGASNIYLLRNTSSGAGIVNFSTSVLTSGVGSSGPRGVSIGDLDGDGKPDLVIANSYAGTITIYKNNCSAGFISFGSKTDYTMNSGTTTMTTQIADLDGDGKLDILVPNANTNNFITVLRNNSSGGNISLQSLINYTIGVGSSSPSFIAVADVDADGKPDIVTANTTTNTLSIIRNQINGPVITSFTPTSSGVGGSVIISGINLTGTTDVSFGGVAATSFTQVSSTAIIATVGSGASGNVTVTTPNGTSSLAGFTFTVPVPTITSFSPTSGIIGSTVTITGTNFSATAANNIAYFGGVKATVTAASATSLTVTVPYGTTYQPISVTTSNLTAYSAKPFIVTFAGGGSSFTASSFSRTDISSTGCNSVGFHDLDGDGKLDVVVASNSTFKGISVYRNTCTVGNLSFATRQDFASINGSFIVCAADYDGDGKQDIAYVNNSNNTVGILRNLSSVGNISLGSEVYYSTGANPFYIASGDFDGDGKPDLVVCNVSGANVSLYLNTSTVGNISFASKIDISVGSQPIGAAIADLDGDGKVDIITSNQGANNITILKNYSSVGNLSFVKNSTDYGTGSSPRCVSAGDIDGDGKIDLVVGNSGSVYTVSVLRNLSTSGSISFASKIDFNTGNGTVPTVVTITDLDGDGKPDLTVADELPSNVISVLRNVSTSGNLSFETNVNYATGNNPYGSFAGDLDGDGKPDIAAADGSSNQVSLFRNQIGEPVITSFTPTAASSGSSVIISGTNFTGVTGVNFGGVSATSFTVVSATAIIATVGNGASGNVTVATATGSSSLAGFTFVYPVPTITSFSPTSGAIGSTVTITGTNFSSTPSNNIVYFGAVKATITAASTTSISVTVPAGASYLPISVTTNGLSAYSLNSFDVTFSGGGVAFASTMFGTKTDYAVGTAPQSILLGDFDGDGKSDYVYVNTISTGTVAVYRNTGTGKTIAFTANVSTYTGSYPCAVMIGDVDGDGKLDLVVTNLSTNTVSILRNTSTTGSISFASKVDFSTGNGPEYFAIGDVDGDGRIDMIITAANSNTVSFYRNTGSIGNISFASAVTYSTGIAPTAVAIADLNNDGKPDIAVTNYNSSSVSVLINRSTNGTVSFDNKVDFATTSGGYNIDIHDLDGDGKPDLIIPNNSNNGSTVSILKNINTTSGASFNAGSLATKIDFTVGSNPAGVSVADIDGDGKPDVAVSNRNANTVSLLRNISSSGSLSFDNKVDFATATDPRGVVLGDIDNDGKPDILSVNPNSNSISILRNQLNEPTITSFTPSSQVNGQSVIISGANFTGTTSVTFGGVQAASFTVVSSTAIIATVGNGASGNVTVTTPGGTATMTGFTYTGAVLPAIISFTPTTATSGTTVTIIGTNFTGATAITFGGTNASSYTVVNATTITAVVANGASGNISVTTPGGTATLSGFKYCAPPTTYNTNLSGCNSVSFKNVTYNNSVVLRDTLKSAGGCDSAYNVTYITVYKVTTTSKNVNLSGCNSVLYNGKTYTTSTIIRDTVKSTQGGCDSIYNVTNIIVNKITAITNNINLSGCNSVTYKTKAYTSSTVVKDTVKSYQGCDSIYNVANITVTKVTATINNTNLSGCNSVIYKTKSYTNSTIVRDTVKSYQGCDSIYNVANITVNKITAATNTTNLSGCNSVLYKGNTYTISTTLRDTVKSYQGCDSIYNVTNINVNKITAITNNINLSGCNSVTYKTKAYTSSTVVKDTVKSYQGCDSIYNVANITVTKVTATTNNVNLSGCNSVIYKTTSYTNSTIVKDTVKSYQGCDSVYNIATITVNKITATSNNTNLSGCNSVLYKGNTYTTSTTLRDTVKSYQGCDSIYNVTNIIVNKITAITNNINLSGCNSVTYKTKAYTSSTVVKDTVKSYQGCDSVYNVANITVTKVTATTNNINLSGCNSVIYKTKSYTTSTIIRDTAKSYQGCDSIYNIATITVNKITATTNNTNLSGCDSVIYKNITYKSSTTLKDTIKSYQGCDSIYNITNITINTTPIISVSSNSPVATGDTIKLYVNTTVGNSFQWTGPLSYSSATQNPIITPATLLMSGSYHVTVNNNGCNASDSVTVNVSTLYAVSGSIRHPKGFQIQDVTIKVGGSLNTTSLSTSNGFTQYLSSNGNYTIVPQPTGRLTATERNKDKNEITTLDVALIQSHILQKTILNSPYKVIAADVNNDGTVSTLDIVFIKRVILGLDTSFKNNKMWGFVDSSYVFTKPAVPFPHKDSIVINSLSANQSNQSFIGFILGDVNWSATAPKTMLGKSLNLFYDQPNSVNGNYITIPVTTRNFSNLIGLQYTMNYNANLMELVGIKNNPLGIEYVKHANGKVSFLWNDPNNESHSVEDGAVLFELIFKPKSNFSNQEFNITNDITGIEAVDGEFNTHNITLEKLNIPVALSEQWEANPVPTTGTIQVKITCKESKTVKLVLTSLEGKVFFSQKKELIKGTNLFSVNLKAQNNLASGTYYLKAEGLEADKVKNVIIQ